MPKINVYLPDDLAEAVKAAGLPVSPICQRALEAAVRRVTSIRETAKLDLNEADPTAQLERFTAKARATVDGAIRLARESDQTQVGTYHLLLAMIDVDSNLALHALRSMEIEPDDVREDLTARSSAVEAAPDGPPTGLRLSSPAATVLKSALDEAISLAHNYIGCEHLLLGMVNETDGIAGEVLRSRGAEPRLVRRAVQALLQGFMYARSQGQTSQVPQGAAEALKAALAPITERLDRLEQRMDALGS
jgi:ATP-dependent Clp protease ATP-binding subunit ClpC